MMDDTPLDPEHVTAQAAAGRLTHVLTVLSSVLLREGGMRRAQAEAPLAQALARHWRGETVRLGALAYGLTTQEREGDLEALCAAVSHALVGRDVPGLVTVLPAPSAHATSPEVPAPLGAERGALRDLVLELAAVASRMGATTEALEAALRAEIGRPQEAPIAQGEVRILPEFDAEKESFRRLVVGFGALLRRFSARADDVEAALAALREQAERAPDIDRLQAAVAALEGLAAKGPQIVTLDARSDFQRVLVGHRAVLRDLSASADAARAAAEKLAQVRPEEEGGATSGSAAAADAVLARLESLAGQLHGLAERMADRHEVAASSFFEAEKVGLNRILVGFRATLRLLSEHARQPAEVDAGAAVLEALQRIETRLSALEQIQSQPTPPQVVTLDARADFQRILVGHRLILRQLSTAAQSLREATAAAQTEPAPPAVARAAEPPRAASPLEALAELTGRIAQMQSRLDEALARAAQTAPDAEGSQALADLIERGARDARGVLRDFLDVAAALSREWSAVSAGESLEKPAPVRRGAPGGEGRGRSLR